jgi:teichuronic acid biosynthesis glycosyltransferase TuaC
MPTPENESPGDGNHEPGKIKILSFSLSYPNPGERNLGVFVRSRLQGMAAHSHIKVVAPIAILDYAYIRANGWKKTGAPIPRQRQDDRLEVFHPRWFYFPGIGCLTPVLLALAVLPGMITLRGRFPFDVIDAHFGYPTGIATAWLAMALRCPFVVTLRGNETMHGQGGINRFWLGWALRRASRVITVSERLRQFALGFGVPPQHAITIPNGIDTDVFYLRDRMEMRARHNIPADARMVLTAGYLIKRKGHHRVIRALSTLRAEGIGADLWIVGGPGREGTFQETLRNLVRELELGDRVHFIGPVPGHVLAEYMSAADVFCLASTREGWPNVVHEALGCGTSVVATDVGGVPDLIPSGEHGFVVPIGDQGKLVGGLRKALQRSWDRDAIAARARSRSWAQVASEVMAPLREIVAERKAERKKAKDS